MDSKNIIGIMSGTSLDGVDLAYCRFDLDQPQKFNIVRAKTYPYASHWKTALSDAIHCSGTQLAKLHAEYASHIADCVGSFIAEYKLKGTDLLAFHGHTLFHQPDLGFTFQLGSGAVLAVKSGIDTVSDFRSANVALGGQGAPLVPIGDMHLFDQYDACLNLGGFGNISFQTNNQLIAFDICPVNMALNEWAHLAGLEFDRNGELASSGQINQPTLHALNSIGFYATPPPRSLGREWYEECFRPVLKYAKLSIPDVLATTCEHIAIQIAQSLNQSSVASVLVSGGGAHNQRLLQRIQLHCKAKCIIADPLVIDFKEALIFAYLGWLRLNEKVNILSSYTGSRKDHCAGSLHRA